MSAIDCFVIRHAESQRNPNVPQDEWPLSVTGQAQAETLSAQMVDHGITRIYSSPYPRALATVRPLANALGISVDIRNDLRERRLATGEIDNWREELEKTWLDFDYALPTGESSRACQQRVRACVLDILRTTDSSRIAICSHGNAIALLLNSVDPSFLFAQWAAMGNPHLYHLVWDANILRIA
jgi:2,3-bisphosphoglycerate-dependent phosphoglycerate mutase